MSTSLTTTGTGTALKGKHVKAIIDASKHSHAPATRRNYRRAWRRFIAWCEAEGFQPLPASPEVVAAHLTDRAAQGLAVSSLGLARSAIRHAHAEAGHADPCAHEGVRRVLRGIARQRAEAGHGVRQAAGLTAEVLAAIKATAHLPRTGPTGRTESPEQAKRRGAVDYALAAVMRDGLLRRGEASALTWADVSVEPDGSGRLTLRRSKTDQEGLGAVQYLAPATVAALQRVRPLTYAGEHSSLFAMSGRTVCRRLQAAASAAGFEGNYSGHAARVGMARDLTAHGASLPALMVAGRWASPTMPAHYARAESAAKGAVARYHAEA